MCQTTAGSADKQSNKHKKPIHKQTKEFLSLPTDPICVPEFLINVSVTDQSPYRGVPFKVVPPVLQPSNLKTSGILLERVGMAEPLLMFSVRHGLPLTVQQLKLICIEVACPFPASGTGSGKRGGIIKHDWAVCLVDFLFPSDTVEERARIVEGIMGRVVQQADSEPAELIEAVAGLDPDNAKAYKGLVEQAKEKLALMKREFETREVDDDKTYDRLHYTPPELRHLIPSVKGCFIKRHPLLKWYQAFYPGSLCLFCFSVKPCKLRFDSWLVSVS